MTASLFDPPIACAMPAEPPVSHEIKFLAYHQAHPEVYRLFEQFVFEILRRGITHYSADAVMHRVRWETLATGRPEDDFKINNNYVAYYARMFIARNPHLTEFFETRKQKNG